MIVGAVVFGTFSSASAQDYQPSTKSSSIGGKAQSTSTALPRTGSSSTVPMIQLGVVLVVAGGFLVITARKRSHRPREAVDA